MGLSEQTTVRFTRGIPPPEAIPSRELAEHTAAVLEEDPGSAFQYAPIGRNRGDLSLRERLGALHGVDPEGVFVGNGSLQVLDLLAGYTLADGPADVFVEAPTYDRAAQIFEHHGGRIVPLPLEPDGLDVAALEARLRETRPAFLYTIPDFQNPSGVTTSAEKRRAIADLAATADFPVFEDAPYRELRYHGEALPSLAEVAGGERVVVLGSLSKVLSPGLRIGYALTDPDTALALAARAEETYLSPAPLCQAVAARALAAGLVGENVERIRSLLRPRLDSAVDAARSLLGDALLSEPEGGYYLSAHLPVAADEDRLLSAAREEGVLLTRGSAFYPSSATRPAGTHFVRLPFQALAEGEFSSGLERLARVAERLNG